MPWRLALLVEGLFLVVHGIGPHGLDTLLRHGLVAPLPTAAVAATGSNLVNNLPAYLAHNRLLSLLLGVNLGPLVLPWGSLAPPL